MGSSNFTYERPWIVCGFPKVTSLITELDWIQFYLFPALIDFWPRAKHWMKASLKVNKLLHIHQSIIHPSIQQRCPVALISHRRREWSHSRGEWPLQRSTVKGPVSNLGSCFQEMLPPQVWVSKGVTGSMGQQLEGWGCSAQKDGFVLAQCGNSEWGLSNEFPIIYLFYQKV